MVAVAVYGMPVGQALDSGAEGAVFGIFPIMYIVFMALWIYNMTVETGHFAVLRRAFNRVSDDQRIQAVIIAFCFGALLEALAGFGTPVAITAVMLIARRLRRRSRPRPSRSWRTPRPSPSARSRSRSSRCREITGLPKEDLGAMVGRQTPILALIVPLILVGMVDGGRGVRQAWPAAVVGGFTFAIAQFLCSNYVSVELTDIVASLIATGSIVLLLQIWKPSEPLRGEVQGGGAQPAIAGAAVSDATHEREVKRKEGDGHDSTKEILVAFAPYLIIIAVFALAQLGPIKDFLDARTKEFDWPGLNVDTPDGEAVSSATFKFNWASAAGTLLLVSGLLTMLVLRFSPGRAARTLVRTLDELKWATLTVASVLALAYVMNLSGQTITLGQWIAGASGLLPFLSSIIGWLGVAVTGSDTSSNSLFGDPPGGGGREGRLLPDAARRGELLGRRARQDDLAAEPRDRRRRGRTGTAVRASSSARSSDGASCWC